MKVQWSDDADRDRDAIVGTIWANNPAAAHRMDELFGSAAARLGNFPRLGRESAVPGMRELIPHPSYRLVYEITDDEIVIHSLVHTSRQWPPDSATGDDA